MDAVNVRTLVILTGPVGRRPGPAWWPRWSSPTPGASWCSPRWTGRRPTSPASAAGRPRQLRDSVARGARGLKVLKELGLYVRDRKGKLVAIDDPRWDPIWAECGRLGIPVAIHSGDPEAFFHPTDAQERAATRSCGTTPTGASTAGTIPPLADAAGGARPGDRPPPAHHVRRPALRGLAREPRLRLGPAEASSQRLRRDRRPPGRARPPAAARAPVLPRAPGPHPVRHRHVARRPTSTPTTSAGWRPPTNISPTTTTPRRAAGTSTASSCPTRCSRRSTTATPTAVCADRGADEGDDYCPRADVRSGDSRLERSSPSPGVAAGQAELGLEAGSRRHLFGLEKACVLWRTGTRSCA